VDAEVKRRTTSRLVATTCASSAFLVLVIGITYFAILVYSVHYGEGEARATAFREIGLFLSGKLAWYQDARVYGAAALLFALISLLFGVHPLARITLPVAGIAYALLHLFQSEIQDLLTRWARSGGG